MKKRVIIGITGSLASGKTTVADMFKAKGACKIDADAICHKLLREDTRVKKAVRDFFGKDTVKKGQIDRPKLAEKVFGNKKRLKILSEILHPRIVFDIKKKVNQSSGRVVIIDAPLLIEAGLHEYVDIVIAVTAKRATQIKRALARGMPQIRAREIIKSQMPLAEKIKFANYIIDTETGIKTVKKGVNEIWKKI